ncbi:unnamed protein product, partial [Musa acuminata subsp. burmannicoides]
RGRKALTSFLRPSPKARRTAYTGSSCPCSDSSSSSRSRSNAVFGAPAIEISLSLPPPLLRIVDVSLLGQSENPDVNESEK